MDASLQELVSQILGSTVLITKECKLTQDWKETGSCRSAFDLLRWDLGSFWECCGLAIFSYTGTEIVAFADAIELPKGGVPKAVRCVTYRSILYSTLAIIILGLTVSKHDPLLRLPLSPGGDEVGRIYPGGFIIMAERAGMAPLTAIVSVVMSISTLSVTAGNILIMVYPTLHDTDTCKSRGLYLMSRKGYAPAFLSVPNRFNIHPRELTLIISALFGSLAYISAASASSSEVSTINFHNLMVR